MTAFPKYLVHLRPDGSLRVMLSSGSDCTSDDQAFVKKALESGLRGESLRAAAINKEALHREAVGDDRPVMGVRFVVDKLDVQLEQERTRQGVTRASVARAMFVGASKLTDYVTGRSRPSMESRRMWGFVLGLRLKWIPVPMESEVDRQVQDWFEQDSIRRLREERGVADSSDVRPVGM